MRVPSSIAIDSREFATSILAAFVLFLSGPPACADAGSGGLNVPGSNGFRHLVLISIDGFGSNYQDIYATPALDRIAGSGVRAKSLRPVFPTLTFPNHYSIATGLYPAQHGIVHNHFPNEARDAWYHLWDRSSVEDGSWYRGEPIWVAAERRGLVSAAFYFVGTEAPVGGIQPSYWNSYDETVTAAERVDQVVDWLRLSPERRPHVITLYFENVDDAGHDFGQGSRELAAAVELVDAEIGRLLDAIETLGLEDRTAVFVVSDHGQANYVDLDATLVLEEHIDLDGLTIQHGGSYAWIYQDEPDREAAMRIRDTINASWDHGVAILREDAPAAWRVSDAMRYPEIFVLPDLHYGVVDRREDLRKIKIGDHGWPPEYREMHGIFLMSGAGVPTGQELGEVSAVDIYPLMLEILGIRETGQGGITAAPATLSGDE
jgi:predicted AlkP superfamily pyrophosphatase or phosphodiesterase